MSGIKDFKITDTTGYEVSDVPGETLSGTVAENKAVFDKLGELIITKFNDAMDYLYTQGIDSGTGSALLTYPVGSIYLSVSPTNPTTLFGGTWAQLKDRFLLAAGDTYTAGTTGGEATHTLTKTEMPSHTHPISGTCSSAGVHTHVFSGNTSQNGIHSHKIAEYGYPGPSGAVTVGSTAYANCGGNAHLPSTETGGNHTHYFSGTTQSDGAHVHTITASAEAAGSGAAFNEMPPYLTVYVWKRTA